MALQIKLKCTNLQFSQPNSQKPCSCVQPSHGGQISLMQDKPFHQQSRLPSADICWLAAAHLDHHHPNNDNNQRQLIPLNKLVELVQDSSRKLALLSVCLTLINILHLLWKITSFLLKCRASVECGAGTGSVLGCRLAAVRYDSRSCVADALQLVCRLLGGTS